MDQFLVKKLLGKSFYRITSYQAQDEKLPEFDRSVIASVFFSSQEVKNKILLIPGWLDPSYPINVFSKPLFWIICAENADAYERDFPSLGCIP